MPEILELTRIQEAAHDCFPLLLELYTGTFPPEERHPPNGLIAALQNEEMYFMAIVEKEELLGFIIYWEFEHFRFIEHFAIFPEQRGRNVGGRVLQQLMDPKQAVLLEVEPPADELSRRRIDFYLRNGFYLSDIPYQQPPYHAGQQPLPMLLMTNKPELPEADLKAAVRDIHQRVYGLKA